MLRAEKTSFRIGQKYLLSETTVEFVKGTFHVIMGANGAGKSTFLKLLAGDQKPSSGNIFLNEKAIGSYTKKELAIQRSVLSQHYHISFPVTVFDIVLMGRYPYFVNNPSHEDVSICNEALQLMDVSHLKDRDYTTLSGGEAQKVQMSRVLAQIWDIGNGVGKILFLDEPVSHLDIKYQHQLLQVAKGLCAKNTTVIAVLHDINLTLSFADRILFMKEGKILFDIDAPAQVIADMIKKVFDISSRVIHAEGQKPIVVF